MKKPNSVQFILSAKKIISVNALYGAKLSYTSASRPIASMYKKSEAKMMEAYIKEQVRALDIPHNHTWINKNTKFKFSFTVIFKSGYLLRDLDNCCKNLIDGVFRALGINDSHVLELHAYKSICPDLPEEKICVSLEEYVGEPRFDKLTEDLPVPGRIFLGGTCVDWGGNSWRSELIPELERRSFSYFNPVVKDWTPECIEIENEEKNDRCDSHLYILTPAMKGMYSVAEIINSAHEVRENNYGSMICGILGSAGDWGEEMWRSLNAFVDMVKGISGKSPRIVAKFIEKPVDLLECYGKKKRTRTNKKKVL